MPRQTVDGFYRAWLDRDLRRLADVLDEDIRWSSPATLPGGASAAAGAPSLEQAALVFERFPSVVLDRAETVASGEFVTVRGRYRTPDGRRVDFVDHIHVRAGGIVARRGSMRAERVRSVTQRPPRP